MTLNYRFLILATSLVAMPLVGALAQSNPTGNYGTNKTMTAAPGTADNNAASGLSTADANAKPPGASSPAGNYAPGSTGRTVVPGSNSSVGADATNSSSAKTSGGVGGGPGGGAGK